MYTINIQDGNEIRRVEFEGEMLLSDALRLSHTHFNMPCGGNRTCGKCRINASGALSGLHDFERDTLSDEDIADGVRLACCTYAVGNATLYYNTNQSKMQVVERGAMPEFNKNPVVKSVKIELDKPDLENPVDDENNIYKTSGLKTPLKLLQTIPAVIRNAGFQPEILSCDSTAVGIAEKGGKYYGAAVDIGTTTVAAYLYELSECKLTGISSGHNAQASFGADVTSRIEYASSGGMEGLQNAILTQINGLFGQLAAKAGITASDIYAAVITGNTVMLHLLCGIEPKNIAVVPFAPASLFDKWLNADELGINLNPCGMVYLPRCITAYVGADIVTGLVASGMGALKGFNLFIDVGTNGEMALGTPDGLVCCSTAAGPAFEGAGLHMGMAGIDGAVSKVWAEGTEIKYEVIGDVEPQGICGSGILDAVATMLKIGVIDETGVINEDGHDFERYITEYDDSPAFMLGDSGVQVTQKDIRQIQLAKSAIAAGIYTLLHECGIDCEGVDMLFIAGGFGSFINQDSAAAIGLFPECLLDRVTVLGNAAGTGASMLLLSEEKLKESAGLGKDARTVELSANPYFMDKYVECMMF